MPLSAGSVEYDYIAESGHARIGTWIDSAAQLVGR